MSFANLLSLLCATAMLLGGFVNTAEARTLDPSDPDDALEIAKRFQCGAKKGDTAVFHFSGNIYSRVPGERDRLLFKGEGMNIRRCDFVEDPVRGSGYRIISREVLFYLDPKTGEVVDSWENPWTGETVDVMQVHNDPVNNGPNYALTADGKPSPSGPRREHGPFVFYQLEVPLFYTNPLAGDYQDFAGGKYHAMEIFDFAALKSELYDTANPTALPILGWVRISQWMPWMKMGSRSGIMVFNFMGGKLEGGFEELPDVIKNEIRENYPIYEDAPPLDDMRPNETTWTKFKMMEDARREATGESASRSGH